MWVEHKSVLQLVSIYTAESRTSKLTSDQSIILYFVASQTPDTGKWLLVCLVLQHKQNFFCGSQLSHSPSTLNAIHSLASRLLISCNFHARDE